LGLIGLGLSARRRINPETRATYQGLQRFIESGELWFTG
jgi:hypothetical protein